MRLSYEEVLKEFAHHVGLESEALLHTEEVHIAAHRAAFELQADGETVDEHLLGVQQATGAVTLCGRIAIDDNLGGESLAALLGGFVDTAAFWKAFVEGTPEGDGGTLLPPSFAMRA